ncbi:MAG: hypothetical protein NWS07_04655 [Desulfobacterales bacterium]|nr:hypothetical protein [Desulfobacterales bacterium]MDP4857338.1 hypothetical protein [Desulfobacterales bacterium]MDP4980055.1 hypothetical protein [Desulfobacterales bacterium]
MTGRSAVGRGCRTSIGVYGKQADTPYSEVMPALGTVIEEI